MGEGWQRRNKPRATYPDEEPGDQHPEVFDHDHEDCLPLSDEDPWDAFVADDDHEPEPEPGDFWWEE